MTMRKVLLTITALLAWMAADAQTLVTGGQFMDLLLPMEGSVAATASDWGTTAGENTQYSGTWEGTLGRWKDNGIEDTDRSYWGGNIIKGSDGKYHIYVAGWPSATVGHMGWSSKSRVYHVMSDNVWGPYTYVSDLGTGHNPEIYKTGDTYVIYKIEPLGYYKSTSLSDTWETGEYTFDLRDRTLIAGENRETSLSNCSFAKREDGSFVMIDRGGGIWVSRDGLTDPWHQLTDASVYLNNKITNRGTLEDPVIWRDHLQYHMIVNDWKARYAYYYRSMDGLHWTMEDGKAYTGQDPFAKHANGDVEKWHKYERPRVYQDHLGRAIRMNFAVIDCVKQSDLAGDDHSSKNINMPLTKQLLLEVQAISSTNATVLVKAEDGFNPKTDLNFSSLKFGSHDKVNYGSGFSYASHTESGDDVVITFTGSAGSINAGEWAPKMLGQKADGSIAFGYAKMPAVDYKPAMLSAVTPAIDADGTVQSVSVTNYGQSASSAVTVRIYNQAGTTLLAHGTTSTLAAYATETVTLTKDNTAAAGYTSIQVRFYNGEALLNTEKIPLTAINAAQSVLQTTISEAETYYNNPLLTVGRDDLKTAIDAAKAVVTCYNITALESQGAALKTALNTFKYANASPTNGLAITIENATMDAIAPWMVTRNKANNDNPGWSISNKGASYDGFDGNFMEYWVSQSGALSYANRASQTLPDMPAGRYRLRAMVIACRQNNTSATTGVTLFANNVKTDCKTANNTPTEFMVEIRLTEAGPLTIGIDIPATTEANWVAWDNVSLKYFGTADGDIVENNRNTPVVGIDPKKVYRIKHLNTNRNRFLAATPDANGHLLTTNSDSEKGEYSLLPVLGRQGYYYIYNTQGYFVTPSTTYWTLSKTTPAEVLVTLNNANQSALGTTDNIYLLGESSQHANPQVINNTQVVYAYSAHETDKGNNWVLEPISNATASLPLNSVTTGLQSITASADAEDVTLKYTATVGNEGFGTLVLPFDAPVTSNVNSIEIWSLNSIEGTHIQGTKNDAIIANKPVLLKGTGTIVFTASSSATYTASPVNGLLHGTYTQGTVSAGNYVLQNKSGNVAFYKVEGGSEPAINPFRAYLSTSGNAPVLTFAFDQATSISAGYGEVLKVHGYYDLSGRHVGQTNKGLSIIRMSDGSVKKVLNK